MPFAYSADLRQKVLNAINNGMRPSEASRVFQLSRNTINLWRRQFETKGTLVPEPPRNPPRVVMHCDGHLVLNATKLLELGC